MDTSFEWAVALACWAIVILVLVQTVVWIVLAVIARRMQKIVEEVRGKFEPKVDQIMVTVREVQKTVSDVSSTVDAVSTEVRSVSTAVTVSAERISTLATESAEEIREMVRMTSEEIKSLVANTSGEVQTLVRTTSGDVQAIVRNSRDSAENAVGRMDLMVERTAMRVEETGVFVQEKVLDPVREVSAIVVGIKVALETLLGYPERKPIDQAYSEEELFI